MTAPVRPVAFVTGASSGLGRGLALRLARDGYAVGLAARRREVLERLAGEIRAGGGAAAACPCDVSRHDQVREAVAVCVAGLGAVDLLVCCAGVGEVTDARELSVDVVERAMRVNFLGSVHAVAEVLPGMLERGSGHLVGIGSQAGYGGLLKGSAYSASKGALHNFFESVRLDLRGTPVDVTFITPGWVRTPLTDRNLHRMPFLMELDDAVERMARAIRLRKPLLTFPRPLSTLVWIGQVFPARLYDALASRVRRDKADP
ncbi:MAG TPA: SDR family NAD(P)-dependent oxidoreductase [Longimicrobiales bacterium]